MYTLNYLTKNYIEHSLWIPGILASKELEITSQVNRHGHCMEFIL